jgi:hypothetical protein
MKASALHKNIDVVTAETDHFTTVINDNNDIPACHFTSVHYDHRSMPVHEVSCETQHFTAVLIFLRPQVKAVANARVHAAAAGDGYNCK